MALEIEVRARLQKDLSDAIEILKRFGATEIFLFGSLARGTSDDASDIDIATVGLPKNRFFAAYGELLKSKTIQNPRRLSPSDLLQTL